MCFKKETVGLLKKCFHVLFQVIITNEIPVTLLLAYIPIPRHVLIRWIIGSRLCTAVGGQQFCKQSGKLQTRIMFENYYSFVHYCLLSSRYVMLQKSILNEIKWGAQAVVKGGRRPWPHRSDGSGYQYKNDTTVVNFVNSR